MKVSTTVRLSHETRMKLEAESKEVRASITAIVEDALRQRYGLSENGTGENSWGARVTALEARVDVLEYPLG